MSFDLAPYRKAVVAVLGIACQLAAAGVLPPQWQPWAAVVLAAGTALGVYAAPNRPLPGADRGAASLRHLWWLSGTFAAALALIAVTVAVGPADARPAPQACPAGYQLADVHAYGQRIEAGIDPVTHTTRPALVQSQPGDTRYVVALACVRDLTGAERDAQRAGLSTAPLVLPLALPEGPRS